MGKPTSITLSFRVSPEKAKALEKLSESTDRPKAHRLERYRAGRRMDFADAAPDALAAAMAEALDRPLSVLPVETDGAARAARMVAEML